MQTVQKEKTSIVSIGVIVSGLIFGGLLITIFEVANNSCNFSWFDEDTRGLICVFK